jgi:hypothetical protein
LFLIFAGVIVITSVGIAAVRQKQYVKVKSVKTEALQPEPAQIAGFLAAAPSVAALPQNAYIRIGDGASTRPSGNNNTNVAAKKPDGSKPSSSLLSPYMESYIKAIEDHKKRNRKE